ncbi:MAG: DNA double-strand break repair nuclease NurA [bacterium]|nr:DNA double-strand break repair nuclease NurA [bacterium]
MLDRAKLAKELQSVANTLFVDCSGEYTIARDIWQRIADDPTLCYRVRDLETPLSVPTWEGKLSTITTIEPMETYHVLSVDGSQIYPDRHQGPSCFLINTGSVALHYGNATQKVILRSQPYVFSAHDDHDLHLSTDLVNCRRQEFELRVGLQQALEMKQTMIDDALFVLLFDGSLIFWLLEAKERELKDHFLSIYLALLNQLHEEKILVAGYISLPKSKELVNIVRLALHNFDAAAAVTAEPTITHVLDATIAHFFLKPFERSIVFKNNAAISEQYPDHLRAHFFYVHVGTEVGRVEIPAWIARDAQLVDDVARVLVDQCAKGGGYPIAIAEAHEQAVVKGPDRDFFYHLLTKMSMERQHQLSVSQKSMHKRRIGI